VNALEPKKHEAASTGHFYNITHPRARAKRTIHSMHDYLYNKGEGGVVFFSFIFIYMYEDASCTPGFRKEQEIWLYVCFIL
jgi:hypothetical protein